MVRADPLPLDRVLCPSSVAVVGASTRGDAPGNRYVRNLRAFGYDGRIAIVHPSATEIEGEPCFRSLSDIDAEVDYAFIAVPAAAVPDLVRGAGGQVAFAQIMSSGFGETGGGEKLEAELVDAARTGGVRLIGPNCLGVHSPWGRVTFVDAAPHRPGHVGVISQSGGLGVDILRCVERSGLALSGVVTTGNAADVQIVDVLRYFLDDDRTHVVGMYVEGVPDGRALFDALHGNRFGKPVVILKGGRSRDGLAAAQSHTGALGGDHRAWEALARQTGCVTTNDLDDFIAALVALQHLPQPEGLVNDDVVLIGNGGGAGVLAADRFNAAGWRLTALAPALVARLEAFDLPPGSSYANPVDLPAGVLAVDDGRVIGDVIREVLADARPGALLVNLNLPVIVSNTDPRRQVVENLVEATIAAHASSTAATRLALVLRGEGLEGLEDRRQRCREIAEAAGVAVFGTVADAVSGLTALRNVAAYRHARGADPTRHAERRDIEIRRTP